MTKTLWNYYITILFREEQRIILQKFAELQDGSKVCRARREHDFNHWLGFQEYIPGHLGQHSSLIRWAADLAFFRISTSGAGTSSADIGTDTADISRSAADIDKNTADIGKNASNKLTKNLRRSPRPHSPGSAGRVNTRLCLVASSSTSGWRSNIIRLQHFNFHSNILIIQTLIQFLS